MRIGIGVTNYNRPEHRAEWDKDLENMKKFGFCTHSVIIDDCSNIAEAKNRCLKELDKCKYIFLFDDDCKILTIGFSHFFIEAHRKTGEHHFLYLKDSYHKLIKQTGKKRKDGRFRLDSVVLNHYQECGGVFMFLTKEVIQKVGGFNKNFGQYGFEHAEYSQRIHAAGLNSSPYIKVKGTEKYLAAMDYGEGRLSEKQRSSIDNKEELIEINRPIFIKAMNKLKIHQPI